MKEKLNLRRGNIPTLRIVGETLPEAWEKAVLRVWDRGIDIRTEYDRKDSNEEFIDPPSKDATAIIEVKNPFAEPRIHKNFPGGLEALEIYRQEIVYGIHDHWINPKEGKWTYTYHGRLTNFEFLDSLIEGTPLFRKIGEVYVPVEPVDQLDYLVEKSVKSFYSRRVQATTWNPRIDPPTDDSPCLQRIWIRIAENEKGEPVLNMNTFWRSRDLYKAWFMNVYAITDLQRVLAERISEKWGRDVKIGRYVDVSDSLHIYGSYFTDAEKVKGTDKTIGDEFKEEIEKMRTRSLSGRTWYSNDEIFVTITEETRQKLKENPDFQLSK